MAINHVPLKYATGLTALREHRQLHDVIVQAGEKIDASVIARCKNPGKFIVVVRPQPNLDTIIQDNIKTYEREDANRLNNLSHSIAAGTELFKEGETSKDIFILLDGSVEVEKGNEIIATITESGSFIGEMAVLTHKPRTATVRTVTDCRFYTFKGDSLLDQAKKQPIVLAKMCKSLAQKLSGINAEFSLLQGDDNYSIDNSEENLSLPSHTKQQAHNNTTTIVPTNTTLFHQNDTSLEMYILLRGSVAVIIDGKQVASLDTPGTLIGEMSGLLCQPRTATIITTSESTFCVVPPGDLLQFGTHHPNILMKMCLNLANRLNSTNDEFLKLKKQGANQ